MSARFLLDSNVLSDFGNAKPWAGNIGTKINLYGTHRCYVSAISWHELMFGLGALGGARRSRLNAVYAAFPFVGFDRPSAIASAKVRRDLGSKSIDLADALIAGQAIAGGFILVSRNARHFARAPGLHLVNWSL